MESKIIQIIPAPESLCAIYYNENNEIFPKKIICLGLTDEGNILLFITNEYGMVVEATGILNFKKIDYIGG